MNTTAKFAGFAAGIAAVFAVSLGIGALVGPTGSTTDSDGHDTHATADDAPSADSTPGGLLVTDAGYTLRLEQPPATAGAPLRLRILDESGAPLTRYTTSHDKELHLIV